MNRTLVTGATGFIGRHLVSHLVRLGYHPRVLVRDRGKAERLFGGRVETIAGELPDRVAAAAAVAGIDTVLHLAARATAVPGPGGYERDNVMALDTLLTEAANAGVRRFVHVSTQAVVPPIQPARDRRVAADPTLYAQSKAAGEALLKRFAGSGLELVIVRPTRVYGPGPWNDANGTTRLMALYLTGRLRFRPADGEVLANYVYVEDVAQGILLAAEHGRCGQAYPLGGQDVSLREFFDVVAQISGRRRRMCAVSPRVLRPAVGLAALWGRCSGRVALTPDWFAHYLEDRPVDIAVSRRELGYAPLTLREGVSATLPWLLEPAKGDRCERQNRLHCRETWA